MATPAQIEAQYFALWATVQLSGSRLSEIDATITRLMRGQARYEYVALRTPKRMPWVVIALLHLRECDLNFSQHLHNGDPLSTRTVRVPKGRPLSAGPWTWEQSAFDALRNDRIDAIVNWDIAQILGAMERYNGLGYRKKGLRSPYIWGATNHQQLGKYVRDGVFDPDVMDRQLGVAALLHRMCTTKAIALAACAATKIV